MTGTPSQLVFDLPLRQALDRKDFIVSASNSAAVELIDRWPRWPTYGAIIVGDRGSGKTHLTEVFRKKSTAHRLMVDELEFEKVADALSTGNLVVEDIGEAEFNERALFHALNLARQQDGHILLTSRFMPRQWKLTIPDLSSRIQALPVVSILPPDDALLRGVLVKNFTDRQISVSEQVVSYLVQRMPRSLEAARDIAIEIDRQALAQRAEVTRPFVARIISQFTNPEPYDEEG
jgi:chromosomal replication initiation ATPase DnaA